MNCGFAYLSGIGRALLFLEKQRISVFGAEDKIQPNPQFIIFQGEDGGHMWSFKAACSRAWNLTMRVSSNIYEAINRTRVVVSFTYAYKAVLLVFRIFVF